jgi:serine/threonine protein phosphatase PrpC
MHAAAGALIAPLSVQMDGPAANGEPGLGPLRVWPGGLCVSRGIGDIDVGDPIIASPHIRQVIVPEWGCRVILASDGVWDCISTRNVLLSCKGKMCGGAANAVIHKCLRVKQGELVDDTTCCVVDCRPYNVPTFQKYMPDRAIAQNGSSVSAVR